MASLKASALAAITCISGPPWMPGKIIEFSGFSNSALDRISPPRGPLSVLWVVLVTKWAMPTGFGYSPAATRPA